MTITNPFVDDSTPTDRDDQALVVRIRSGNREGLEELVQRHQPRIYNIAVRMLYHPQDAQDATQEILIKMLTRLSSFEGRSRFRTWLYRIAVNHVLNMKRGRLEPPMLTWLWPWARRHPRPGSARSAHRGGRRAPAGGRGPNRLHRRHVPVSRSRAALDLYPRRDLRGDRRARCRVARDQP
jgi:hypothetical protein